MTLATPCVSTGREPIAPTRLAPLDGRTLRRMLRYALDTGAELLHLRVGSPPLVDGLGGARELRFRQLAREDLEAALALLFQALRPTPGGRDASAEAARPLAWLVHWPDEALFEVHVVASGLAMQVTVDILRPLAEAGAEGWLAG